MANRVIFHVDANSAFLSWTAVYRRKVLGEKLDLRTVPSVIAGDRASRHSIILAKSLPAKRFGIQTGEPLFQAQQKCPELLIAEPDYALYVESSRHFVSLLREFSPCVEQYSIDEAWVDMTGTTGLFGEPCMAAERLRRRVKEELGFTVNVGVSSNKLLAKIAGDFEKPDKVHTLFPDEIQKKMWPLPVRDLFMVGAATERKLRRMGICTIGELAQADPVLLQKKLYKPGLTLWHWANGRDTQEVRAVPEENKGYGNSVTVPEDLCTTSAAHQTLLSLCETVGMRLRKDGKIGRCLTVSLRSNQFEDTMRQQLLPNATNGTEELYHAACRIFDAFWDGKTPLRQLGVQVTRLEEGSCRQYDFLSEISAEQYERKAKVDEALDEIREKYGEDAVKRARFVGSKLPHMAGGLSKERRTGVTKEIPKEF